MIYMYQNKTYNNYVINHLSPEIDFYIYLLLCVTSWTSNHKFNHFQKYLRNLLFITLSACPLKRTLRLRVIFILIIV